MPNVVRGAPFPALLRTGLLSVHTGHQATLPKSRAAVAFGSYVTLPSGVGRTSVNWVIQSLSSFFDEWEHPRIGCQLPLSCAQFSGAGCWMVTVHLCTSPPATYWIHGLHTAAVELAWGILLPRASECLGLRVYISKATVWKLRDQTESKEFRGHAATASSFGGLILWLDS